MSIDAFTIDQISAFVSSSDQTKDEQIEECARKFAFACEEANERLSKCKLFLMSGHRTQAIRFAEQDPPIKKVVELLSLDGMIDVWEEAVAVYGWSRFQRVKSEILTLIEEAYPIERETVDVLNEYRKLSLAKAPLSDRLLLLRQLSVLDPTNPVWISDIELFEKGLMHELSRNGYEAIASNDVDELALLVRQHDQQDWKVEFPSSYVGFLKQAFPIAYRKVLIPEKVRSAVKNLKQHDPESAILDRDEVFRMVTVTKIYHPEFEPVPQTQQSFDEVCRRLTQYQSGKTMKAFQHDLQVLQSMLGGRHTKEQVQTALEKAGTHGIPIPPIAVAQVEACLANLKDTKVLTTIAITSLIVLVIALSVLAVLLYLRLG